MRSCSDTVTLFHGVDESLKGEPSVYFSMAAATVGKRSVQTFHMRETTASRCVSM